MAAQRGKDILLKIEGWPRVEQVLRHIDAVEAIGIQPHDVAPDRDPSSERIVDSQICPAI